MQTKGEIHTLARGEVAAAWALEVAGYPAEEAASLETLEYRQREAGELFLGNFINGKLIGFICGTRSVVDHLTARSIEVHEPTGTTVCIHSLCVDPVQRRHGIALRLLRHLVETVPRAHPTVRRICLISHQHLLPLYTKAGFTVLGPSSVTYGPDPWYECAIDLS
ncbi:serotonin N-acetyltransferase-like [Pristis pectinata]|uniref:serotonin N-acetyltransferase-like n=1 Tax=Pristis pectinata TaxID=685728 RepID=UPI00223D36D5|nr:serotonin N-acetyltransferase-like [Pristis pectinata]